MSSGLKRCIWPTSSYASEVSGDSLYPPSLELLCDRGQLLDGWKLSMTKLGRKSQATCFHYLKSLKAFITNASGPFINFLVHKQTMQLHIFCKDSTHSIVHFWCPDDYTHQTSSYYLIADHWCWGIEPKLKFCH